MALHVAINHTGINGVEHVLAVSLIDDPMDFADMHVALLLTEGAVLRHGVQTEQVEPGAIGHNVAAGHRGQLTLGIAVERILVKGIIAAQVLIQADTDRAVAHNHTLIERTNLGIHLGYLDARDMLAQILEHLGKIGIDIIHVGILLLGLGNERLQGRILIESQELSVNLLIIHLTDTQHILDKRAALQQMNTVYPMQTRTLIEDMLELGVVNDPEINSKFLNFYQDTTLQIVIADVQLQYADMDDINKQLDEAFNTLKTWIPDLHIPLIYSQIGALNQSIVVGDNLIGISLDKYLGSDYPIYLRYDYSPTQLQTMKRSYIVPDCICFYLLSLYPLKKYDTRQQMERDLHMGKVMWTVNQVMGEQLFKTEFTKKVDAHMKKHPNLSIRHLLENDDYSVF